MNELQEKEAVFAEWDRQFEADVAAGRLDANQQEKLKRLRSMIEQLEIINDAADLRVFLQSLEDVREGRVVSQEDVEKEFL